MAEKTLNSRIIHKHDIEDNWQLVPSFIPKQGEIIIYDIDSDHDHERMKIGDGITQIDQLPFISRGPTPNILTVKQDGTGDFTTLKACVDSISGSSKDNPYVIYIYEGEYDIIQELGGESFISGITAAGKYGILLPDYVDLIGIGKVVLKGEIPSTYTYNYNAIRSVATLNLRYNNSLENLTITAKNMKYPVHDESSGAAVDWVHKIKDCTFIHYGNDEVNALTTGSKWVSCSGYGMGSSSGCKMYVENSHFISASFFPFSCHDNADFSTGSYLQFDNCIFENQQGNSSYYQDFRLSTYSTGSEVNTCVLNNSVLKTILITYESSADKTTDRWRLYGGGNINNFLHQPGDQFPHTINVGPIAEDWVFTLEDGTTVTKKVVVI